MRRSLTILATLLVAACGSSTNAPRAEAAPTISHVVVIMMENHSYSQVIGTASAPYITSLAKTYGKATDYVNLYHPSLPNYLGMTGGTAAGTVGSDCDPSASCGSSGPSIFSQVGSSWKAYAEAMPSHCDKSNSGNYAVRHNPPPYYRTLTNCSTNDVALASTPSAAAAFTFVTPDLCHDMHSNSCSGSSCEVCQGDAWLKQWLPKFMATSQYQAGTTAIFILWDENSGSGTLPNVIVSPYTHGVTYTAKIDHYSTLRTIESLLGKGCLQEACNRTSYAGAFGL